MKRILAYGARPAAGSRIGICCRKDRQFGGGPKVRGGPNRKIM